MPTIAVLGANGRLGKEVVKRFAGTGWLVVALSRKGDTPQSRAVEARPFNALDRNSVAQATEGSDVIFNGLNPPYPKWRTEAMVMARNVLNAVEKHGAHHLFPGNVYGYGTHIPPVANEETPQLPDIQKGVIRRDMEQLFEHSAMVGKSKTTILRAGDFFGGTGTGAWFDLVIAAKFKQGKFTYPGPLDCMHSWAYVPDFAAAFEAVARQPDCSSPFMTYQFGGHSITGAQLRDALAVCAGHRMKTVTLPWWLVRLVGHVYPLYRETAEMAYLWHTPHQLDGTKLLARYPDLETTPLQQAVSQALDDLGLVTRSEVQKSPYQQPLQET